MLTPAIRRDTNESPHRDTTYMVVLTSISLTAILVTLYPLPAVQWFYAKLLNKPLAPE